MAYSIPKVQIVPAADSQVSFQVEGVERLRYHFADRYPRPFFYPLIGPSGKSLTRMGHPAAPDHDHHRSVWFAHNDIAGNNFWAEGQAPRVTQKQWVHYQDGDDEAGMVVELIWSDAHKAPLMNQQLIAVLRPMPEGQSQLEIQTTFSTKIDPLKLNKSTFGFLAVRVAKSLSHHYGGGELRNSEGAVGEPAIFGKPALWVDYSGPIVGDTWEGITYLAHPSNVNHPSIWHVRDDGWMCSSFNGKEAYDLTPDKPLTLRYLLSVHKGPCDSTAATAWLKDYEGTKPYEVVKAKSPWRVTLQRGA